MINFVRNNGIHPSPCIGLAAGGSAFTALTTPTRLVTGTSETYDLGLNLSLLPNTNILAAYAGGTDDNAWMSIAMQQSSDGGVTWSPYAGTVQGTGQNPYGVVGVFYEALTGAGAGLNSRNNCTLLTPAGSLILFWETDDGAATWNGKYSRSTDNGATWSAAAALPAGYGTPTNGNGCVVPGGGVCPAYPSGVLFITVEQTSPSLNPIALMKSTDDGVTWSVVSIVGTFGATEECSITWVGGNTLMGFVRPGNNTPLIMVYSVDAGTTWNQATTNLSRISTKPAGSSGLSFYVQISPFLINDSVASNKVTLLWCERAIWNGVFPSVYNSLRCTSFDPIAVMANPLRFDPGQILASTIQISNVDGGYPSACPSATGSSTYRLGWMQARTVGDSGKTANYFFNGTYKPGTVPLTVQTVNPQSGVVGGGSAVNIYGEGFKAGAAVTIGGVAATSVVVVHAGLITCNTPAGSTGSANVVVTNTNGQANTLVNGFAYGPGSALVASGATGALHQASNTVTLNTVGATLLVAVCNGYTSYPTVTDSLGNTWNYVTPTGETPTISNVRIAYAYSKSGFGLATSASHTITIAGIQYGEGTVYAFSGTKTDSTVYGSQSAAGSDNLSSPISSCTITAPTLRDILISAFGVNQNAASASIAANGDGNTWQTPVGQGSAAVTQSWWASYAIAASATNSNPKWTCAGVTAANEVMAVFHSAF